MNDDWFEFEDIPTGEMPEPKKTASVSPFQLSANSFLRKFHEKKAEDKKRRRGIKKLIKPENAKSLLPHLPRRGETTHAIVRGDFVLGEIIPVILGNRKAEHLGIATLGMSEANAEMLQSLKNRNAVEDLRVIVSHYFASVDADSVYAAVCKILGSDEIKVTRNHAKVILIKCPPDYFCIAGSANLRSSDNIEQFAIWNDEEIYQFHKNWMDELCQ